MRRETIKYATHKTFEKTLELEKSVRKASKVRKVRQKGISRISVEMSVVRYHDKSNGDWLNQCELQNLQNSFADYNTWTTKNGTYIIRLFYSILFSFFWNRQELGQNEHHQVNHSKLWEHQKQSCDQSVFLIFVKINSIGKFPRPFIWMVISCAISSNRQKLTEIAYMKFKIIPKINQAGSINSTL